MKSCPERQADLGFTHTNPLILRSWILYLMAKALPHSSFYFYPKFKILFAYRRVLPFLRFTSFWICLLGRTLYIVSLSGISGRDPFFRHSVLIVGNSVWVQLQSHFTFYRLRITPVPNTCFFLLAYCLASGILSETMKIMKSWLPVQL